MKIYENPDTGCWEWTAGKDCYGYAIHNEKRKAVKAHRFSYSNLIGAIPGGYEINHKCRVKHCVNPEHLEALSKEQHFETDRDLHIEGSRLAGRIVGEKNKRKTHCPKGHTYSGDNLRISYHQGRPMRGCVACQKENSKRRHKELNPHAGVGKGGLAKKKTHCPQGHPYAGLNLILRKRAKGVSRECRECRNSKKRVS